MRRSLLPATAALAALTALAFLGAAIAVQPPGLPGEADAPREAANRALARAFYDAANAAIATGDPAPLAALLAPGFVERGAAADPEPGPDGLVHRLLAIHASAPDVRLGVEALAADGDLVIAHVRVSGGGSAAFLGLKLAREWAAWGPVDVFRVEREQIAERWGPAVDPAPPAPVLEVMLDVPPPADRTLAAARVTLAPGAHHLPPVLSGPRLVVAEAGTVAIEVVTPEPGVAPSMTLSTGEHGVLPPGAGFAVRNTGRTPAALLDIALAAMPWTAVASEPAAPAAEEGVEVQDLAQDLLIAGAAGPVVLSIGRATLEPGERLGWAPADGPVLLHVERGTLDLAAAGPAPWIRAMTSGRPAGGLEAALAAGGGALLEAGTAAEVRAAPGSAATLLVLTLLPANESVHASAGPATVEIEG